MSGAWGAQAVKVALVDGGSFVLPYDYQLVAVLAAQGIEVDVFASRTRYNGEFLAALRTLPGVTVRDRAISGTVAPRWRGALAYLALLVDLWRRRRDYDVVNLQFSAFWPFELVLLWPLRRKLVFTVPPGTARLRCAPPHRRRGSPPWQSSSSAASATTFIARYGERFRARSRSSSMAPPVAGARAGSVHAVAGRPRRSSAGAPSSRTRGQAVCRAGAIGAVPTRACGSRSMAWEATLRPLRDELIALGVVVVDRYLDPEELLALLARNVVFVLPYREASQSGALYSLLHHGRLVVCADSGDLGDFMRRFGLEAMLMRERSADAVADVLDRLGRDESAIVAAFQAAQDACSGPAAAAAIGRFYAAP